MLSITLQPQDEYQWQSDEKLAPVTFNTAEGYYPLYHQWRTYHADAPIIVNTYNTGTGKTKAALLRLLKRVEQRQGRLSSMQDNVLLIAPTNELLLQHAADAEKFCEENQLPYQVVPVTADCLKDYLKQYKEQLQYSEERVRKSWVFHYILRDPRWTAPATGKQAAIYVVNPDIFYYITYFCYNANERHALFSDLQQINYIIIDEFHYYDPKQMAAFLFFIKLSQRFGHIDSTTKQRQFCILTATPRPQVADYLRELGVAINWIDPMEHHIAEADRSSLFPVRALSSAQLFVYNTEELQEREQSGGLLALVTKKCDELRRLLYGQTYDGAIIANSLGMLDRINQLLLTHGIAEEDIGRITGPEKRESRQQAKERRLILATPTVDIGYNFARNQDSKRRQNIDFLFIDAYTGDELIQRIGRAGRVLSKPEKEHPSIIFAVVDPDTYKLLTPYDGQELARPQLSELAKQMARKNDLYAYVRSGAIFEAFRPLSFIRQGMDDQDRLELDDFFMHLQQYFSSEQGQRRKPITSGSMNARAREFDTRDTYYRTLQTIPPRVFELCRTLFRGVTVDDKDEEPLVRHGLEVLEERLHKSKTGWKTDDDLIDWLQKDLATYYKERARFSFRDSFQPPLALISDPGHLLANADVNRYSAIHILKYYHFTAYESLEEWLQETGQSELQEDWKEAVMYCQLKKMRDIPLQVGFNLNASSYSRSQWELQWAYQVTALYGLEIVIKDEHGLLSSQHRDLLKEQFVPAFVCQNDPKSKSHNQLHKLREKARVYPYRLTVNFQDRQDVEYHLIVGSMAFHVCAEIPYWALQKDLHKTVSQDNEAIIC